MLEEYADLQKALFPRSKHAPSWIWAHSPAREQQLMGQAERGRARRGPAAVTSPGRRCRWSGAAPWRRPRRAAGTARARPTARLQPGKGLQPQLKTAWKNPLHGHPTAFITVRMLTWTTDYCQHFTAALSEQDSITYSEVGNENQLFLILLPTELTRQTPISF